MFSPQTDQQLIFLISLSQSSSANLKLFLCSYQIITNCVPSLAGDPCGDIFLSQCLLKKVSWAKYVSSCDSRRSDHDTAFSITMHQTMEAAFSIFMHQIRIWSICWIILFPHSFVFLIHNKNKNIASTLLDHGKKYALRSTLISWPDTCNSVLSASRAHLAL